MLESTLVKNNVHVTQIDLEKAYDSLTGTKLERQCKSGVSKNLTKVVKKIRRKQFEG